MVSHELFEPSGALTSAQRKANERARKKGIAEPYAKVDPSEAKARKGQYDLDFAYARELDAQGFYKSECRPAEDLLAIYYGAALEDKESDEDEETSNSKKKPKKKTNQPNPSKDAITIKAVWGPDGEPVEPACWVNCDHSTCGRDYRKTFEVNEVVSFARWLDLRDKARKDLLWLSRVLGKGLFHSVHQYVCDQYIKKNFDGLLSPGYDLEDYKEAMRAQKRFANTGTDVHEDGVVPTNELMLMEQRGGYKSTVDGIDCVQWVINRPEIRIMVITAFRQLAKKRAKEIKQYFFLPQRGKPTAFHMLFPEFITRGVAGRSDGPLECPANDKNFFKEDTMWFTSMESSATGDHCCILKGDDIVDLKNSADEEMRESLKFDFDSRKTDLLDPWGFVDITGTRYFTDDMYGERFKANSESKRVSPFRYSCRGAWILSPDDQILYSLPNDNPNRLTVAQIIKEQRGTLVFAAKNNWTKLRNIYDEKGERNFKNQQMNEATDKSDISDFINHFTHDYLVAHLRPKEFVPAYAEYFQLWDLAYSESSTSDFSAGVTMARWTQMDGRVACAITDGIAGKWKSSELASKIALFYRAHAEVRQIFIEKVLGYEWLVPRITSAGHQFSVPQLANVITAFNIDNSKSAKRNRIKNLEILMTDERMHFITGADWNDECFKQFEKFTGEPSNKTRKDDYPDVISFAFKCILPYDIIKGMDPDPIKSQQERERKNREYLMKLQHDRMHGYQGLPSVQKASDFSPNKPAPQIQPVQQTPQSPREQAMAQMMKILPNRMRHRGQ